MTLTGVLSLLCVVAATAAAQGEDERSRLLVSNDSLDRIDPYRRLDIVSFGLEVFPSPGGGDFFQEYGKLGSTVETLDANLTPTLTLRLNVSPEFRGIGYGTYLANGFVDIYDVVRRAPGDTSFSGGEILATVVENFSTTAIPVLVGIEYAPITSQFTTYVGGLVGIGITSVDWTTTAREQLQAGYYRPGINVREWGIAPAARVYTGVDLRFDRFNWRDNPIRGIFLEASYTWLPAHREFFSALISQTRGTSSVPTAQDATLQLGGFTFSAGINLQFLRR